MSLRLILTTTLAAATLLATGCAQPTRAQAAVNNGWSVYGNLMETTQGLHPEFNEIRAIDDHPEWVDTRLLVVFDGWVSDVCRTMGCWMEVEDIHGDRMLVMNRDHGFFVPRNCRGRRMHAIGQIVKEEHSVEMLRHLAADAGKSDAEIAAIVAPVTRRVFVAEAIVLPPGGLEKPVELLPAEGAVSPAADTSMTPSNAGAVQ